MRPNSPSQLAVSDRDGNSIVVSGPIPTKSGMRELTEVSLRSVLFNTVGTPYFCEDVKSSIADGLYMSAADLSEMKNRALAALDMKRAERPPVKGGEYRPLPQYLERKEAPEITVSVQRATQLSPELAGLKPTVLYVPVGELLASPTAITPFWENGVTEICAALPPIIRSTDEDMLMQGLEKLRGIHVTRVLIGSLQQALPLRLKGFEVRADFSANVYNSQTLKIAKDLGILSAGLSFELELGDIKDMSKCIDTELIVYGRLPLMYSGSCLIKAGTGVCACDNASHMRNAHGNSYPVLRQPGCRTLMLSGSKMFLADRAKDWANLGLWAGRLNFTTENARECVAVTARYYGLGPYEPVARTKGRYY
jgi:putative protease